MKTLEGIGAILIVVLVFWIINKIFNNLELIKKHSQERKEKPDV